LSKNIKYLSLFVVILVGFGVGEYFYFSKQSLDFKVKREVTKLLTMPDLAICGEAFYIRHRSLASVGDSFSVSPSLLAYFPSDFVYYTASKR